MAQKTTFSLASVKDFSYQKQDFFNILILIADVIRLENENGLVMAAGNEDLSVWMRTSSCLDVQEPFQNQATSQNVLPKGNYTMTIQYSEGFFQKKVLK